MPDQQVADIIETSYVKSSANLIDDGLGEINWQKIVSKKGETRIEHIAKHNVPDVTRETHGVFNGDGFNMTNEAWSLRGGGTPVSDGMGGSIYNIPYANAGIESGFINTGAQMDYITIVTMENTSDIITAFPSFGGYVK